MTFDYYIGTNQGMATDTETAGSGLFSQLQSLYPSDSATQLWATADIYTCNGSASESWTVPSAAWRNGSAAGGPAAR